MGATIKMMVGLRADQTLRLVPGWAPGGGDCFAGVQSQRGTPQVETRPFRALSLPAPGPLCDWTPAKQSPPKGDCVILYYSILYTSVRSACRYSRWSSANLLPSVLQQMISPARLGSASTSNQKPKSGPRGIAIVPPALRRPVKRQAPLLRSAAPLRVTGRRSGGPTATPRGLRPCRRPSNQGESNAKPRTSEL